MRRFFLLLPLLPLLAWVVPLPARLRAPPSTVVLYADGTAAHVQLSSDEKWRIAADLDRVDPDYLHALLTLEDERFGQHIGVDPFAVARAAVQNLSEGRVVSGASTLTMQLARMLEPRPRTLWAKGLDALRALQLEIRFSKREILEAYLSFAPYGRNVEGIEAASLWYFGHSPEHLSSAELATLLAVPQDPNHRFPTAANRARLVAARDAIAARLGLSLTDQPVPPEITAVPREAPLAAAWVRRQQPGSRRIATTLDAGVQRLVEKQLVVRAPEWAGLGIYNAAVVVVEHPTAQVRALAGVWDTRHGRQIIGFDTARSPGSALKPFVYARGIDDGEILPETLVSDIPVRYGGYAPENYDGAWSGMVRMEEALSRSLNIPFIELLGEIGVERFLGLMRTGGVRGLHPEPGHYGLSLIAGGVELTPLELAGLYTTLAQGGRYRALRWLADVPESEGIQLFSPGAAWLTRRTLRLRDRPDFPARRELAALPGNIHWKTGTSFGNRDAWAVGSGDRYTVVVWLGNFDNRSSMHLVGADVAAPLLFDLLEGLGDRLRSEDQPPAELRPLSVCALSGRLPGDACPLRREVLAPAERVPPERCTLHVAVEVDVATGLMVTPACRGARTTRTDVFVSWPASVRRWLGERYASEGRLPPLSPDCAAFAQAPPRLLSPQSGQTILIIPGMDPQAQQVPLEAASASERLIWFVDGAQVAQGPPEQRQWWVPRPGTHEILVMDAAGASASVEIKVRGL